MKHTKEERRDFRADRKAIKKEIKIAKKGLSRSKKVIRTQKKRILRTERAIGSQYYRDRSPAHSASREICGQLCRVIAQAEAVTREKEAVISILEGQIRESKAALKLRAAAFRQTEITEIIL